MSYKIEDPEEIIEYMWLKPDVTNINVDMFVDDGGSYLRHEHELLLLARNGYDKSVNEFRKDLVISNIFPIFAKELITT